MLNGTVSATGGSSFRQELLLVCHSRCPFISISGKTSIKTEGLNSLHSVNSDASQFAYAANGGNDGGTAAIQTEDGGPLRAERQNAPAL